MTVKICTYCRKKFECSRYHPDQQVCSSKECQRRRRTDYHRKKLQDDPVYREQCLDSQRKWRERNPEYMQKYLLKRLKKKLCESEISKLVREQSLFGINENNVAMRSSHKVCKCQAAASFTLSAFFTILPSMNFLPA